MEDSSRKIPGQRRLWLVPIALLVVALFIPFPTMLSPDFTVRFVDESGSPIVGMVVQRACRHYTYETVNDHCAEDWDNPPRTDSNGNVSFSAKYVWYGAISRAMRTVFSYAMLIAHGSVGRSVTLFPRRPEGYKEKYWINIDPDNPQKEIVIEHEL